MRAPLHKSWTKAELFAWKGIALTVLYRDSMDEPWRTATLLASDVLDMPQIGMSIPAAALYEGTELP